MVVAVLISLGLRSAQTELWPGGNHIRWMRLAHLLRERLTLATIYEETGWPAWEGSNLRLTDWPVCI